MYQLISLLVQAWFSIAMSFMSYKKSWMMLRQNAETFRDNEKMLFGPKFEQVIAKSLISKNKSRKMFGSLKEQGTSSETRIPESSNPFRRLSYFIEGNEYFHKLANQSQILGHKKEVQTLSYTLNLIIPEFLSQKVLLDTPISSTSVLSEHFNFNKSRKVKIFSQKLCKTEEGSTFTQKF